MIARIILLVTAAVSLAGCFGGSEAAEERREIQTNPRAREVFAFP